MSSPPTTLPFGVITLQGIQYIERPQVFAAELKILQANEVHTNLRLTLPGFADFLLKGLTRLTVPNSAFAPAGDPGYRAFRFRLLGAEGSTSFLSGGLNVFDDRVVDSAIFGTGQFPYMLIPPIPVHASGSLLYEIQDAASGPISGPTYIYPYTIYFGFHGSYLIPAEQLSQGNGNRKAGALGSL